jgi:hypothetical protein
LSKHVQIFWTIGLLIGSLVSFLAMDVYPGNSGLFFFFCAVFMAMWGLVWVGPMSYFYFFISSFWLLGFWMKACLHLIIGYDFLEPVGQFDASGEAWDSALLIIIAAGVGALFFRLAQIHLLNKVKSISIFKPDLTLVPAWYVRFRPIVWLASAISIGIVAVFNVNYSINIAGLLPMQTFPFKINAIVAGLLNLGFAFWIAALVWWDVTLNKGWFFSMLAIVIEGLICSVSILSRGAFVFQVFHYLPSIYINRTLLRVSMKLFALICVIFMVGAMVSAILTTQMRVSLYDGKSPLSFYKGIMTQSTPSIEVEGAFGRVLYLISDRWVGLEGVMVTSSYPEVGSELFFTGWTQKAEYGNKPIFEYMANSIYIDPDYPNADKYNFLSIPGLVAMLSYGGRLWVIFIGTILFLGFFALYEYYLSIWIGNPFVLSFFAMYSAILLAQFGHLGLVLIQIVEISMVLVSIYLLQKTSGLFNKKAIMKRSEG